jgi:outer membrane protein assembly factor BamB
MSKQDEAFLPERVDEQIETLSGRRIGDAAAASSAHLVSDLRQVYEEDSEIVEQVWARLAEHAANKRRVSAGQTDVYSRSPRTTQEDQRKGSRPMKPVSTEKPQKNKYSRFLEILAAALILAILVGSMALIFKTRQPSTGHGGTSTSTAIARTKTPAVINQTGLYIATTSGVDRVSLQTGKIIWHIPLDYAGQPLVMGGMVFFSHQDSQNYYLEAVNAVTGKELWRKNYGSSLFLQGAHGTLYNSSCVLTNARSGATSCSIYAIKASNGEQLWSYPTPLGSSWITVQDSVVYGVSYTQLFALNAATGTPIWQKTLLKYADQQANMTPLLSDNVLYFASCNTTKHSTAFAGCYFYAFNASNGAELWHKPVNSAILASPAIADGALYYGSREGIIYALNAKTGSLLWIYKTGGGLGNPLLAAHGVVYAEVETASGNTIHLLALKAADRSALWSKDLPVYYSPVPYWYTFGLDNGLIYVVASKHSVDVFHADDGTVALRYNSADSAAITEFTLVTQNAQ